MEAADRMLGRNVAVAPSRSGSGVSNADQGQPHSIGIRERKDRLAETLLQRLMRPAFSMKR